MPKEGVEPSRGVTPHDFESWASAYSATSARYNQIATHLRRCFGDKIMIAHFSSVDKGNFVGRRTSRGIALVYSSGFEFATFSSLLGGIFPWLR